MARVPMQTFATMLAMYVKKNMEAVPRGAMLVRCINDDSMVAAVFGNDNFLSNANTRREVELVRRQLTQALIQELGFGLAPDGSTWTLLVKTEAAHYQTTAGKAFHMEMFRTLLEDAVHGAWSRACGLPPDKPERLNLGQNQPTG
jgi:hypothetical protein